MQEKLRKCKGEHEKEKKSLQEQLMSRRATKRKVNGCACTLTNIRMHPVAALRQVLLFRQKNVKLVRASSSQSGIVLFESVLLYCHSAQRCYECGQVESRYSASPS